MKTFFLFATALTAITTYATKPNIIFIYADDMGWTGTSVEMIQGDPSTRSDFYQTPNLEKLAANGMVFSQAYSPGPMCTPSRASVLTGKTPAELHITTPGGGRAQSSNKLKTPSPARSLPTDVPTIGTLLKENGYATALLGKWHIGRNDAGDYGFDLHDGPSGNDPNSSESDPKEIFSLTKRGIQFMEEQVKNGKPFYLQLSHYAVHTPTATRPESLAKFKQQPSGGTHINTDFAGMTWDLDESIRLLIEAVEKMDIAGNTYFVFMSDNGASGGRRNPQNAPLQAGKGTLYEGGIRIPFIVSGPGIKTGYCSEAVSGTDLFATFAQWAGVPDIGNAESVSLQPLFTGKQDIFQRTQPMLFHYPHYGQGPSQKPQTALVSNHWKLLKDWESGTCKLLNLETDIGEQTDLSSREPKRFAAMVEAMKQRLAETGAQLPEANPDYNPGSESLQQRPRRNRDR